MRILYAASEARPFSASGGLSDVAGSLPQSLKRKGADCRVVMPLYSSIPWELRQKMQYINHFYVPVSWRNRYCGIFWAEHDGVTYYFIDNEYYFVRDSFYNEYDNAERFAFFSRAVMEMLPYIDFKPDVINANDWQTSLIPIYYDLYYCHNEWYYGIKTVITIHNIAFQGKYGFDIFNDTLGLPDWAYDIVHDGECVNLLKGAMQTAHAIVTVSPTYAREIAGNHWDNTGYDFGQGLTPFIHSLSWKLTGILNGVDMNSIDPAKDIHLYENYTVENYKEGKRKNKLMLQERLGLEQREDVPLISIVTRIDAQQKGCQLVLKALQYGLLDYNDAQFVILGSADKTDQKGKRMEQDFWDIENRYRGRAVAYIGFVPELAQKIYAASDIYLMPSKYEPCGLAQIIALKYGAIPVVRQTGGLADTIQDSFHGTGNGFTFWHYNGGELYNAIERALWGYSNPEGWDTLVQRAMNCDFNWDSRAANEYLQLFERLKYN